MSSRLESGLPYIQEDHHFMLIDLRPSERTSVGSLSAYSLKQLVFYINFVRTTQHANRNTSVARGGGGGGQGAIIPPPPPNNAFLEFCRYICKFIGTCKPTSMSCIPSKYLKYQQNIERNSSFGM